MNESQAMPINLIAPSSADAPKRWYQLSMLQLLVAMAVATAVSILNLSSSRTTNLMVSTILVSAAIALTGQIQRADRATDSPIRRRHVLNRVRLPRPESKLLVAIAIMAVFIAQNSAVRASGPYLTRISRTVDFDLSELESGWPLNHWNAYGMVVSGREFVTDVPSVARYSWSAMATNVACSILSIVVVNKFVSFIRWKADRSTGDEANN